MHSRSANARVTLADRRRLTMYAAVYDSPTTITSEGPAYRELIRPGAFAAALAAGTDVIANVNHDPAQTFARTSDGSLLLQEDGHGLFASCWLPENELGDAILEGVQSGRITGASFRFRPVESRTGSDGTVERVAVDLFDVCVCVPVGGQRPAYPDTEVHVRTQADRTQILSARLRLAKCRQRQLDNPA